MPPHMSLFSLFFHAKNETGITARTKNSNELKPALNRPKSFLAQHAIACAKSYIVEFAE